jgi:ribosomal protein S18 acetylase RimI-like enzyme
MTKEEILSRANLRNEAHSVEVTLKLESATFTRLACASCDMSLGPGEWWITRVRIPDDFQGQGIGTVIVQELMRAVSEKEGFVRLSVAPGGYNSDVRRQRNFYVKCGFVKDRERKGLYVWAPTAART